MVNFPHRNWIDYRGKVSATKTQPDAIALTGPQLEIGGHVRLGGSKHCALHLIGAMYLSHGKVTLKNCPQIFDVINLINALEELGANFEFEASVLTKFQGSLSEPNDVTIKHSQYLRSSIILLAPALLSLGSISISRPVGDSFRQRDFRMFGEIIESFSGQFIETDATIFASLPKPLRGNRSIDLRTKPHLGSTGNNVSAFALMLSAANEGITTLSHCLNVAEIRLLIVFLRKLGVTFEIINKATIVVKSAGQRHFCHEDIDIVLPSDKIELGFWSAVCAATGAEITTEFETVDHQFSNSRTSVIDAYRQVLPKLGVTLDQISENQWSINRVSTIKDGTNIVAEYSGILAEIVDSIPHFLAPLVVAKCSSTIEDRIVGAERFRCGLELNRMGARISFLKQGVRVNATENLLGCRIRGRDSRGSGTLLIAGLVAKGYTEVLGLNHANRVYVDIFNKLESLGARMQEIEVTKV